MKTRFPKNPRCEVCEKEDADRFISFHPANEGWKFCGACMNDSGYYEIEVDRFFHSPPATVDWIAHMHEKDWMDWKDFADMMHRFRAATQSYGQP